MLLWPQDCEAQVAGALEMLAGLVTNVLAPSSLSSPPFVPEHAGDLTCSLPLHMLFLHLWCLPPPRPPGHLPDPGVSTTATLGPRFSEWPEHSLLGNLISCL